VRENAWRPYGTHLFVPLSSRHFRAGLSYPAAVRLEVWRCLLRRLRSLVVLAHTLEAAPYQSHV